MKFIDIEQNTDEWLEFRIAKATASRFACFMANYGKPFGEPARRYALQIALERINGTKDEQGFSNDHMERGKEQEPIARMLYEATYFVEVLNGGFFDCGKYGDSPDGLIGDDGVIEIKSVIAPTHYATLKRGKHDPSYHWQLMGHLDCTGRDWVDFVSFCAGFPEEGRLITHRLHRADYLDDIEKLRERRGEFLRLVDEVELEIKENK